VTKATTDVGPILIVGPSDEKLELVKYIERKHPRMKIQVVGVEPGDQPTAGELVAHARQFLASADRMRPLL
jgi:hypothetical protein